jgi:hypothetical protein
MKTEFVHSDLLTYVVWCGETKPLTSSDWVLDPCLMADVQTIAAGLLTTHATSRHTLQDQQRCEPVPWVLAAAGPIQCSGLPTNQISLPPSCFDHWASVKRFVSLQFLNLNAVGRTPWTGDQTDSRPLKHRINAHKHPCFGWHSNTRPQCSSERRQFMP